jgi:hypothetical protein
MRKHHQPPPVTSPAPSQGAIGMNSYGAGVLSQAGSDPVNGRPMIEEDPSEDHRFHLTEEAAVRQSKFDRSLTPQEMPASYWDYSKHEKPSPTIDAGLYKLDKMGVRT